MGEENNQAQVQVTTTVTTQGRYADMMSQDPRSLDADPMAMAIIQAEREALEAERKAQIGRDDSFGKKLLEKMVGWFVDTPAIEEQSTYVISADTRSKSTPSRSGGNTINSFTIEDKVAVPLTFTDKDGVERAVPGTENGTQTAVMAERKTVIGADGKQNEKISFSPEALAAIEKIKSDLTQKGLADFSAPEQVGHSSQATAMNAKPIVQARSESVGAGVRH